MKRNEKGFTLVEIIIAIGLVSFITLIASSMLTGFINLRRLTEAEVGASDYVSALSTWLRSSKTFNIAGFNANYNPASSCTRTFYGVDLPEEATAGVWNGVNISIPVNTDGTDWKYAGPGTFNVSGSNSLQNGVQLSRDLRIAPADGLQARLRKLTSVSQGDQFLKLDASQTVRRALQIRLKLDVQAANVNGTFTYRPTREVFFETLVETVGSRIYGCIPEISLRESCRIQGGHFDEALGTCTPVGFCENSGYFIQYTCSGSMGSAPCNKFILQGDIAKAINPVTGAQSCPPGVIPTKVSEADIQDGYTEEYYSCMRCY
tara:strand:- start:143749 stop:144705 length:957 start_codon:yes stop_codon:yes gene_type:complete